MAEVERKDIQIISRYSNLSERSIDQLLRKNIYSNQDDWSRFLKLFFISLGVSFTTAGIVFFFAYNWADLHKFVKIGLIEILILSTTLIALLPKLNEDIKNVFLTGASILVGVLLAVFGQIYQIGANAYDLFLNWTLFITLWVVISNFAPLWLIFITLINTTFILYSQQVAYDWSEVFVFTSLFTLNSLFLIATLFVHKIKNTPAPPYWLTNILALTTVSYSTIGIVIGILDRNQTPFFGLLIFTSILYTLGIRHGLQAQKGVFLSIIPFSVIIIISAFLLKLSDAAGMYLFISLLIIGSVTLVIKNLINLQRKWNH